MGMAYFQIKGSGVGQLENEFYRFVVVRGDDEYGFYVGGQQ